MNKKIYVIKTKKNYCVEIVTMTLLTNLLKNLGVTFLCRYWCEIMALT